EMKEIAKGAAVNATSEERYRAVVEQTTDGIALIEPETLRVIECNEAFGSLLGCNSVEEAKTLTAYDFSTTSREELVRLTRMLKDRGSEIRGERTYRRRDGSLVQVEISSNYIAFNGQHALCLSVKDISERKEIEHKNQALIKEMADFKFALDK